MIWGYYYTVSSDGKGILPEWGMKELAAVCDGVMLDTVTCPGDELVVRKKLLAELKEGDTLVVPNLLRFGQNVDDLLHAADSIIDRGIELICLDDGRGRRISGGTPVQEIFRAIAVFQRRMAVAATKRAVLQVRARGRSGGRPKVSQEAIARALKLYERNELSIQEITERTGVSKSTLYKYRNERRADSAAAAEEDKKIPPSLPYSSGEKEE